ncbi:hypothetical protein [Cellulosimicrobium protaetiae]|uniref:Uncharacterized protein n=1 Tax=Cellulosimicrobium protaetiae TaxID=2587808 RepID=A0A6M5U959_9MICO|nr:hypothetical protein [Cellulosimicrobium protaetiae]QJW35026.1 hypothetical protein FIC82_001200 [Cellulosimicrobium protaetiae]
MSAAKAIVAGITAIVIAALAVPQITRLQNDSPVDQGDRALLVFSSRGSDRDYSLRVRSFVDTDGSYRFVFYFTSPATTYGAEGNTQQISASVSLVTADGDVAMRCGESLDPVPRLGFDDLSSGTRHAIEVDANEGSGSATNYRAAGAVASSAPTPGDLSPDVVPLTQTSHQTYAVDMWLNDEETAFYSSRSQNSDGGAIWAEECAVDRTLLWKGTTSREPFEQRDATLFLPQINWTSLDEATDHHDTLTVSANIRRAEGATLQEAYPSPQTYSSYWYYEPATWWYGERRQPGGFLYTDQPVFLFANRDVERRDEVYLVWAGLALGVAASLIGVSVSATFDSLARGRIDRRRRAQPPG